MWERWLAQPAEVQAAFISGGGTLLAAVFGGIALLHQLKRQAADALVAQRQGQANQIKLQIYQGILEDRRVSSDIHVELQALLMTYRMDAVTARHFAEVGLPWEPPRIRFPLLNKLHGDAQRAAVSLIETVERWEIVDPRVRVFTFALNAGIYDLSETFKRHQTLLIRSFAMDDPKSEGGRLPWSIPSDEDQAEVEAAIDQYLIDLGTLSTYALDFQTEMQLALLGDVFPSRQITRRTPLDKRLIAVRLEHWEEQIEHFRSATAWGRHVQTVIDRATISLVGEEVCLPEASGWRWLRNWARRSVGRV